jgi:pimeloyl-ACP methyl ester carboxylesterase
LEVYVDRSPACGQGEPKAYVLEFCGNGYRAENATAYMAHHRWESFPVEVWCLNYPGSGRSGGAAKMAAIPPAALAAFDALKQVAGERPIFVEANSLGSVPAIYVASQRPAAGVIVQNPPPLKELLLGRFGWWNLWLMATPVAMQVPDDMNLIAVAPHVPPTMPTLFIQALGDSYVPPAYQNDVIDVYRGLKTILHVPGIGHNDGVPGEYEAQVQEWIRRLWQKTIQQ